MIVFLHPFLVFFGGDGCCSINFRGAGNGFTSVGFGGARFGWLWGDCSSGLHSRDKGHDDFGTWMTRLLSQVHSFKLSMIMDRSAKNFGWIAVCVGK